MDTNNFFGAWLRQRRKALDLTQADLAQRVGCSVSAIRKIEMEERRPSRQIAQLLADCLNIAPADQPVFIKAARGERNLDRLPTPALSWPDLPVLQSFPSKNLPLPLTPLIGRQHELEAAIRLLDNPQCRLLTLTGPTGIGKTRLALETASLYHQTLGNDVYFVPLSPVNSPEFIAPTLADALGFAFYESKSPKQQLLNYLREKQLLLLLDNVEHLLEAVVDLIADIVRQSPGVKLLTTSRERLNLQGEWLLEIQGLPYPEDQVDLARLDSATAIQFPAVAMFVDNAVRVQPNFALTGENLGEVVRICQLLEGMPLGLELASAWVRFLSLQEIAQEMERNLDFLAQSRRDAPGRHQSLWAAFDHSWNLLSAAEQQVMQQLSVFAGSFQREAATAVSGASLALLSTLVDKSLLRRCASGRYTQHQLMRQFAFARLQMCPAEEIAARSRHGEFYLTMLTRYGPLLKSARQKEALADLRAEIDNIRAAWQWAVSGRNLAQITAAANALMWFYERRNGYQEGETAFAEAVAMLEMVDKAGDEEDCQLVALAFGQTLMGQALFQFRQGHYPQALELLEKGVASLQTVNVTPEAHMALADAFFFLGTVHSMSGHYVRARSNLHHALELSEAVHYELIQGDSLAILAIQAQAQGETLTALELFKQAVKILRAAGDPTATAWALSYYSAAAHAAGDSAQAVRLAQESLQLSQDNDNRWAVGLALYHLGLIHYGRGENVEAESYLQGSVTIFREMGDCSNLGHVLKDLGRVTYKLGQANAAERYLLEALQMTLEAGAAPIVLDAIINLAVLQHQRGQPELALAWACYIQQQRAAAQETKSLAGQLLAELQNEFTSSQLAAVQASAQTQTLEIVAREILERFYQ